MFCDLPRFDSEGNMTDVQGHIIVPHHAVNQYLAAMSRQQRNQRVQRQQQAPVRGGFRPSANQNGGYAQPQQHFGPSDQTAQSSDYSNTTNIGLNDPQQHAYGGAPLPSSSYSNDAALPATLTTSWPQQQQQQQHHDSSPVPDTFPGSNWLTTTHHAQNFPEQPGLGTYGHGASQSSPPRSRASPTTPVVRVTDWTQDFSQPQDATTYPAASPSTLPQQIYYNNYSAQMAHPYPMPQDPETMQTPVSPVSADNTQHDHHHHHAMGDEQQLSRKRSHSVMSQQDTSLAPVAHHNHSRAGSIGSAGASPNDPTDDFSPRGSRAFKRGDPPVNALGKYICTFAAECGGHVFDRKCEWSKHMDKHDRPYRCPHPQCAKLQGFTYSGGLLRHEREVHGKHGGPKSQLMCPHSDCKRHTGKGFTRKENLNEHLRRVHPNDKESQNSILTRTATDITMLAEEGETPISKMSEPADHEDFTATSPAKRKRSLPSAIIDSLTEDPEREIKRLRAEIQEKDYVIQQFEADALAHAETRRQLEALQALHQHQQQAQQQLQPGPG